MHIFHYATFVRATRLVPFAYDSIENKKKSHKKNLHLLVNKYHKVAGHPECILNNILA